MTSRIDVTARRISAVENREVLHLAVIARWLAEARKGFAKVHRTVVGVAAARREVHLKESRFAVDQHRHRAGTLGWLSRAAERVLGDVRRDDDRLPAGAIRGEVSQRSLEPVDAGEAGVLELRHLTVAREEGHALR